MKTINVDYKTCSADIEKGLRCDRWIVGLRIIAKYPR